MGMAEQGWRVGELAKASGLTVRALRYYDRIGLLSPSQRTPSGYRLYANRDVRRLYQIPALRSLDRALAEIRDCLDNESGALRTLVHRRLQSARQRLEMQRRLGERLGAIAEELDQEQEPSVQRFMEIIEKMTRLERYLTPDQVAKLKELHRDLTLRPRRPQRASERNYWPNWKPRVKLAKTPRACTYRNYAVG
jgi:DNA-binding transcriptional MerR regulator